MYRRFSLITILATSAISGVAAWNQPSQAQDLSFVCTVARDEIPTTIAQTPEGPLDVFKWQSTYFRPPYTPMQRCQEVTQRMNQFQADGMLENLTSGKVNNLPVICAGSGCESDGSNVLLTLRRDQNPNQVLQEITSNRAGAGGPSRQLSGGSSRSSRSSALSQNADGTMTLNLNQHLRTAKRSPFQSQPNAAQKTPIYRSQPTTPSRSGGSNRW